jgi:uncharacterized protein (DUF305 family)
MICFQLRDLPHTRRTGVNKTQVHSRRKSMNYETRHSFRNLCMAPIAALCFTAWGQTQAPAPSMPAASAASGQMAHDAAGSAGMKSSMAMGMDKMQKMPMSGDTDKDFAMMMKMHHQQGVDMARMELQHGKSPAMKKMAQQIIAAQNKEIAQFDRWLAQQK